jgi:hypothetical protein
MLYLLIGVIAFLLGALGTLLAFDGWRRKLLSERRRLDSQSASVRSDLEALRVGREQAEGRIRELEEDFNRGVAATRRELAQRAADLEAEKAAFEARVVSYGELQGENTILKRDLQNVDVHLRKLQLDEEARRQEQERLDQRSREMAGRFLKDNVKWISSSLNANNFAGSKQRLQKVVEWVREVGFPITGGDEQALFDDLKAEYERVVRIAFEREEQARIRAQIREEQRLEKEADRELKQVERERAVIQAALAKALAESQEQHTAEIGLLKARLAEAEERSQRAISQAQMTKSGHVYVISNIGSFGVDVFKIGMTRRLEPLDRVRELGDASVPFPFDVHMMISSNDAPSLENALHRKLHKLRINRANPRKEFFKVDLDVIRQVVVENHGEVQYVADPEALEYRQSLTMTDADEEFIERVYEKIEDEGGVTVDEE